VNLNELAKEISKLEGGRQNLSIAQIKEVVKCLSIVQFLHDSLETVFMGPNAVATKKSLFWKLMVNGAKQINKKKKTR
jgi:hypothetical protein